MYLFAIIDWHSRKVIAWELFNTLDVGFCLKCLRRAIMLYGPPEILNTDQGCHFTSEGWRECAQTAGIRFSMDVRDRWLDNVVIERFWRTIKYEDIYLKSYETPVEIERGIEQFVLRYNIIRPHQSLSGATPDEVFIEQIERSA
jgi:putative transposase